MEKSLFMTQFQHIMTCNQLLGRKEMFYLMMHLTHFIYGYMAYGKETFR